MKTCNFLGLAAAGLAALGVTQAEAATVSVSGLLYGTNHWVATNEYVLSGFTYVAANSVLNIEAGTVIKGVPGTGTGASAANDFGCLFVLQGGKLNANGTPSRPIIMTTEQDDVTDPADLPFPSRGLWGGLVMFGKARINNPASTTNKVSFDIYEGLPDTAVTNTTAGPYFGQVDYLHRFGGTDDADSSGSLRFVSIRHGGKKLTTDKEINGLSLGGVGNGTVVDFVEAYCIADDGFEFFGGSVNTKHLVSAFNDDDAFDTDQGYNGKNQFWFSIQDGSRDQGSEQNGQPQPNDLQVIGAQPLSRYTIYNATLIGAGGAGSGNDAHNIRRNNFCRWYNSVFTEFQGRRVRVDADSNPEFANNLFFGFAQAGTSGDVYGTHAGVPAALNPVADPLLRAVNRGQNGLLDPRPQAGSPVFTGVRAHPGDGFFTYAPYKGAFDAQDVWIDGWTALSQEGVSRTKANVVDVPAGYLYGTHNWVSSNTYVLKGFVYVMSNAVLNIEPGTVIKGVPGTGTGQAAANDFGCLFVTRGGKLNAALGLRTGLWTRGGRDHLRAGQPARQLDGDRAHTARAGGDQQRTGIVGAADAQTEPIEERLPGSDRGQRHGRGLCEIERTRLATDDALINQMPLRIGARAGPRAGVEHLVARLEQRDVGANRLDHAGGIETQHAQPTRIGRDIASHLGVDRVDRYRVDAHQQVATGDNRFGQLEVDQTLGIGDRQALTVSDGFHGRCLEENQR